MGCHLSHQGTRTLTVSRQTDFGALRTQAGGRSRWGVSRSRGEEGGQREKGSSAVSVEQDTLTVNRWK